MQFIQKSAELLTQLQPYWAAKTPIAFVPTMGALHEGHLKLIDHAKATGAFVVSSIFVNPTQFDNATDLDKYPRMPDQDASLLEGRGCDLVFCPQSADEIYPHGIASLHFELGSIENVMEGAHRPGHFQGVATVLSYFFGLIRPKQVFMGEKDYQQLQIVRKLVSILKAPIEIVGIPTIREHDGLAMSSRNLRLTKDLRKEARRIFSAISFAQSHWQKHAPNELIEKMKPFFENHPEIALEYIVFADGQTLNTIQNWEDAEHVRCFIACRFSDVRLIDNMALF
jgi:pantoate--beta-alanine ligase